jgi:hypothetical protein
MGLRTWFKTRRQGQVIPKVKTAHLLAVGIITLGIIGMIAIFVLAISFHSFVGNSHAVETFRTGAIVLLIFAFFAGSIFLLTLRKGWQAEKKHTGEPQLNADGNAATAPQTQQKPQGLSFGRFVVIMILIGIIFMVMLNYFPSYRRLFTGDDPYPNYKSDPLAVSPDVWEVDKTTPNYNHANDCSLRYFDVVMKGDGEFGKEGHISRPTCWNHWKKYWVSKEPNRHVGFLFSGDRNPIGPIGANLPPQSDIRFDYKVNEWMVQGVGTLRYERID